MGVTEKASVATLCMVTKSAFKNSQFLYYSCKLGS